jgi:hypothetical protein
VSTKPALEPVLGERIARHGLTARSSRTVAEAVRQTTALQAQDPVAGRLGVFPRSEGLTDADVRQALDVDRTVVKNSLLRGTIHLVAVEDLRWLTALIGPVVARGSTRRWDGLGLTSEVLRRCADALPDVLAAGPLRAREAVGALRKRGVPLPEGADGTLGMHLLLHAATTGLVCRGPDLGRDSTYVLRDQWVPGAAPGPRGEDALAELARRYFAAFSPATGADFTAWSGLPAKRAVELIRDELTPCEVFGRTGFRLGTVEPERGVALLPAFDNYLLGYRERPFITPERRGEVFVGGVIRPTLLVDGRVAGRWRLKSRRSLVLTPFEQLGAGVEEVVYQKAKELGRFLGRSVDVVYG